MTPHPYDDEDCTGGRVAGVDPAVAAEPAESQFRHFALELTTLLQRVLGETPPRPVSVSVPAPGGLTGLGGLEAELRALRAEWADVWDRRFATALRDLELKLDALSQKVASPPVVPAPERELSPSQILDRVLLGQELTQNAAVAEERRALAQAVLAGQPKACALAGQLLLFQSAEPPRLPQILKEMGEAFYQWHPKCDPSAEASLEVALVDWLNNRCAAAEIQNLVELVQPGDRFDPVRHNSEQGGNEVRGVLGWVVARRGSDRPFAKARVSVR